LHRIGPSIGRIVAFGTFGPEKPADVSLKTRSTYPCGNWQLGKIDDLASSSREAATLGTYGNVVETSNDCDD